jgi:FHA domain
LARYRLRFVLQEFDLPRGATLIGRSLECHLTIDDPLVSRLHARITVGDDGAQIEDLGSRNGVRVNGTPIRGLAPLRTGDRVRIGTQDLMFTCMEDTAPAHARTTGKLRLCVTCRCPYPREMVACPGCGATEQTDDETPTGIGSDGQSWSVQLLVEALERALRLGRAMDAEGLLRRAAAQVDELVAAGTKVDADAVMALATQATKTALACNDPGWATWAIDILGRSRRIPPTLVVERFAEVAARHPRPVRRAVTELLVRLGPMASAASPEEIKALATLKDLREIDEDVTGNFPTS